MNAGFRWILLSALVWGCGKAAPPPVDEPPGQTPLPPEILELSQSATTVEPGGTVTLRASARDPLNSELRFSWKAAMGTLGTPVTAASSSEVVWTTPACAGLSQPFSAQLTVSNAWNLTDVRTASVTVSPTTCLWWPPAGSMSAPRTFHTSSVLPSGKVLLSGGGGQQGIVSSAELYDPAKVP